MNSLIVSLHYNMVGFYWPTVTRHKVLVEHITFPFDHVRFAFIINGK